MLAVLAMATAARGQSRPEAKPPEPYRDQIVAEVDHEPITLHELELAARLTADYRDLKDNHPDDSARIRQSLRKQLDLLLDERILLLECTKEKIVLTKDDEKHIDRGIEREAEPHGGLDGLKAQLTKIGVPYDYFIERKRTNLLIAKLLLKNVSRDIYVNPEQTRKYYEERKRHEYRREAVTKFFQVDIYADSSGRIPAEVKPLVEARLWNGAEAKKYADNVREKLAKSPGEWRAIVTASTMDGSAIEHGGLVQLHGGKPVESEMGPLGKAVDALKPGEVSQVTSSALGYHVFCLKERSSEDVLPFSEVQHEIEEKLRQEIWQERLKGWINRVKEDHPAHIYMPIE